MCVIQTAKLHQDSLLYSMQYDGECGFKEVESGEMKSVTTARDSCMRVSSRCIHHLNVLSHFVINVDMMYQTEHDFIAMSWPST